MKKMIQLAALAVVVVSGFLATSCAPTPTPSRSSNTTSTVYVKKPVVTIRNNSYKTIVVGVQGPERRIVTVPARSKSTLVLRSGVYKYAAAAKNTRTISGYKTFSPNGRYNWDFGTR